MLWRTKPIASLFFACLLATGPAHAVVILSGGPNNTAPGGQPYFGNIGTLNGASAIYLGNRWAMSAHHVAGSLPASVNFGGSNYSTVPGTYQQLTNNSEPGLSAFTDIVLFQLTTDPLLPWLNLASATPTVGTTVMMIGNGRVQESSLTSWDSSTNPWAEVLPGSHDRQGFKTTGSQEVRWGVNLIDTINLTIDTSGSSTRSVTSYSTLFGGSPPFAHESQGVVGDSGGAVFSYDGVSTWTLSGMMHAINGYANQPANTAVLGQSTFVADLSFYRSQILTITQIPEPSASLAALIGFCALLARRGQRQNNAATSGKKGTYPA